MKVVEDHLKREHELGHPFATVSLHHGAQDVARAAMAAAPLGWRVRAVWRGEASVTHVLFEWSEP